MVKSLRAGRKFLTPEMRFSRPTPPMPPSRSRSVNCGEMGQRGDRGEVVWSDYETHSVGKRAEALEELAARGADRLSGTEVRHAVDVSEPGE